jgi:hypothetical protein
MAATRATVITAVEAQAIPAWPLTLPEATWDATAAQEAHRVTLTATLGNPAQAVASSWPTGSDEGKIHAYEVWNEPQLADFMHPYTEANTNRLALMTKRAYKTIKSNDPSALVGAASVLPRPTSGGMKRAGKYLRSLKRAGWNVDFFTCHIYPEPGKGAKRWRWMLRKVQGYLVAMNAPTRKLWITETAYGLLSPDPIPDAKASQLVRDTYKYANGKFVFWYAWNRPDLKGFLISHDTAGWKAVKRYG